MAAGEEKLRLVLSAIDKTAAPIRRVNRRIEEIQKPVRKVRNALRSLARESGLSKLGGMFSSIGRAASRMALVGVGAIGAVGAALVRVSNQADELAKLSRQLGISVEALQEYEFAAERSGVSSETLRSSLGALGKRVGELQAGKGALATLLKGTELAEQLKATKTTEEALELVTAAIARVEDPTKKAALAAAAFSRAGLPMIRLANEGADGIAKLREEARALGGVLSTEATREAEAFQDSLTDLKTSVFGLGNSILADLMPVVRPLIDQLTAWVAQNRELIRAQAGPMIRDMARSVFELVQRVTEFVPQALAFLDSIGGFHTIAIAVGAVLAAVVIPAVVALAAALGPVGLAVAGVVAYLGLFATVLSAQWDGVVDSVTRQVEKVKALGRTLVNALPASVRNMLGLGGGVEATIETPGTASPGAAAAEVAAGAAAASAANVGGRITVELDDRRARVTAAETTQPDLELDLAGGEALAPA